MVDISLYWPVRAMLVATGMCLGMWQSNNGTTLSLISYWTTRDHLRTLGHVQNSVCKHWIKKKGGSH